MTKQKTIGLVGNRPNTIDLPDEISIESPPVKDVDRLLDMFNGDALSMRQYMQPPVTTYNYSKNTSKWTKGRSRYHRKKKKR